MIRRHLNTGLAYLDQTVINCYLSEIDDKYFNGNMQKKYYERTKREIDRFVSYVCTGRIDALPNTLRGARQKLTPKFEQIAEEFIAGDFHPNTRCDIRWVTYKYFARLEEQGFTDMAGVGVIHIQKFLLSCSEHYAPGSILNARPSTADDEIFLRIKAPHTKLAAAVTVGEIYRDCCIAAGLPASTRFHNLRRALGTSMVTNGISVYDVAQVFGDKDVNSTKPYLATDVG